MKGFLIFGLIVFLVPLANATENINFTGVLDSYEIRWTNNNNTIFLNIADSQSSSSGETITNLAIDFSFLDLSDIRTRKSHLSFTYNNEDFEYTGQYVSGDASFFHSAEGTTIEGTFNIEFRDGTGTDYKVYEEGTLVFSENTQAVYVFTGVIKENEKRINGLESWQDSIEAWKNNVESWMQTIGDWKSQVSDTLTDLASNISELFDITNDHENRISVLEVSNPIYNISFEDYWAYLDFRDREQIACGFGLDNDLELYKMLDLGASCFIDYSRSRPRCDCEEVSGTCDIDSPVYCYAWELRRDNLGMELLNTDSEDIEITLITITGCEPYDRTTGIRAGDDRRIRIDCFEEFTMGDISIEYVKDDGIKRTITGSINI